MNNINNRNMILKSLSTSLTTEQRNTSQTQRKMCSRIVGLDVERKLQFFSSIDKVMFDEKNLVGSVGKSDCLA